MIKLIVSNLRQRPTRACVSILAVSLGVVLVLVSVGLSYGQLIDQADRTRRMGGDFMLQPTGASLFFGLNSGTMDARIREVIERVEGVEAATPILLKFLGDRFHLIFGVDLESFFQVNSGLSFVSGRIFEDPFEAVIDTNYSVDHGLNPGSILNVLGHEFTISGVIRESMPARILIPMETMQELNGTPGKASMFFIRVADGESVPVVEERLKERFEHYNLTATSELQELMTANAPVFRQFVISVVAISIVISFLIILLAMYSTITERTREIGILKSLGASRIYIVRLILKESLLLCVIGVAVGFVLTSVAIRLILMSYPSLPVAISPQWQIVAAALAIAGGSLGSLYPAIKAAKMDPVEALGYE